MFYYESETSTRPSGIIFLEGSYCERLVSAPACILPGSPLQTNNNTNNNSSKTNKEEKLQVMKNIFGRRDAASILGNGTKKKRMGKKYYNVLKTRIFFYCVAL